MVVGADIEIHALNLRRDLLFKWTLPFHLSLALLLLNLKAQTARSVGDTEVSRVTPVHILSPLSTAYAAQRQQARTPTSTSRSPITSSSSTISQFDRNSRL